MFASVFVDNFRDTILSQKYILPQIMRETPSKWSQPNFWAEKKPCLQTYCADRAFW
jgi:hypothetical protein